ncbi:hypothetical protein CNEO2_430053 [Clostridium neonatale]|uniref:Uncharacterized protein n=2 Tax=Clostridium neonatale TaxID=137838 RepID=A0AA86JMG9_9CLOT|nr:hypothetical protein CNEO_10431 [Clostridium neonatale]CAI3204903.1 hypothetical protein CNEO2_390011 [Clostridium neonatale]CAI3623925.1 hypothetical protein CNEO2_400053 [Clostridium neonatale]CAI3629051.1 hypothetical protein CNEO2_440011 [Clostridium neonatale]CAI3660060.1 hypothetical protein CNEO2_430053 [Clostridium neonatale]
MRECSKCANYNNLKNNVCNRNTSDYCTCRRCGYAVRYDNYSVKFD